MAKTERSKYQQEVIGRYYDNLETIMLNKLGELVSELYLAKTDAQKEKLWQRAAQAMKNLKVNAAIIDHILAQKNVVILAKNLQDWLTSKKKK